ncbi:MAG: LytTR family DNA-binding domain-containing protein [Bacillota bacterium]|nr:LytTR family DNA-binding domain-containing protein [Bacillota bacterium]
METPIQIAVCEDVPGDVERLLHCIDESGLPVACRVFTDCAALLADFAPGKYDLIFLDIYMNDVQQGVNAAASIRELDALVTLAFTTVSQEHALESYRLKVFAYLEKPVQARDVREVLEHAGDRRRNVPTVQLLIQGKYQDIPLQSILYFECKNHAVFVNTLTGVLRTSQTVKLGDIEPLLPDCFFRCHNSYIANLRYVKELDRELKLFRMQNDDPVYIRRQSLGRALRAYEQQLFALARGEDM